MDASWRLFMLSRVAEAGVPAGAVKVDSKLFPLPAEYWEKELEHIWTTFAPAPVLRCRLRPVFEPRVGGGWTLRWEASLPGLEAIHLEEMRSKNEEALAAAKAAEDHNMEILDNDDDGARLPQKRRSTGGDNAAKKAKQ